MSDAPVEHRMHVERLTPKEQACLRLVARRMSSKEIAAELGIAKTSVDTYCNRAREKLGVIDRFEAARLLIAEAGPGGLTREVRSESVSELSLARSRGFTSRTVVLLVAIIIVLAIAPATLLAGIRALDVMKPQTYAAPARSTSVQEIKPR